jgi:hypothetical protein
MYISTITPMENNEYKEDDNRFEHFRKWCGYTGNDLAHTWVPQHFDKITNGISTTFFYRPTWAPSPFFSFVPPSTTENAQARKDSNIETWFHFRLLRSVCLKASRSDLVARCDALMAPYAQTNQSIWYMQGGNLGCQSWQKQQHHINQVITEEEYWKRVTPICFAPQTK